MNILFVDDDSFVRKSIYNFLSKTEHEIFLASDGKEAFPLVAENRVDLVITDVRMPEMTGYELLQKLKLEYPEVEVILVTGFGDVKSAVEAMKLGAFDYLLKPVDVEELLVAVSRVEKFIELRKENEKLTSSTQILEWELENLRKNYSAEFKEIGVFSSKMENILTMCRKLSGIADVPVLIEGETGTGKEVIARYIHNISDDKKDKPFIAVNCAALTPTLFESELFGHEAGSFTGANPKGQIGKLELAKNGTIFLDEISEIPLEYQAKLLRVLQEREFYRVGGIKSIKLSAKVVASTNRNLADYVEEGKFRRDLFFRFSIGVVKLPPLRERKEEIVPLALHFIKKLKELSRTTFTNISDKARDILESYKFPGNVRELKGIIERLAILYDDSEIRPSHLNFLKTDSLKTETSENTKESPFKLPDDEFNLNDWTLKIISDALVKFKGNKQETARYLGISRGSLYNYLKKLE